MNDEKTKNETQDEKIKAFETKQAYMNGPNTCPMPPNMMPMGGFMPSFGFMPPIPPLGGMMNVAPPQTEEYLSKKKLESIISNKENFFKIETNTAKRIVLPSLKYAIEQAGIPQEEVGIISENILKEELTEIFKCLESPAEIKKRASK